MTTYQLRVGGSSDFVSAIRPDDTTCVPPDSVNYVPGWNNPDALTFSDLTEALASKTLAEAIDGVHLSIEEQ